MLLSEAKKILNKHGYFIKEANEVAGSKENMIFIAKTICDNIKTGNDGKIAKVWMSGGAVRDEILGKPCNDIDLLTNCDVKDVCALFDKCEEARTKNSRLARIWIDNDEFEVGCLNKEDNIINNLEARDITINAILKDLSTGKYYDPTGGLKDIKSKKIQLTREGLDSISQGKDPAKLIRALRFVSQLGWDLAPETIKAIQQYSNITGGKIKMKLNAALGPTNFHKMMRLPFRNKAIKYLKQFGFIDWAMETFPEDFQTNESIQMITEGGNVELNGYSAEPINISVLDDNEYEQYKQDIIKLLISFNNAVEKETGVRLYKNDSSLKAGKYFSGSSEQFFKYSKDEFVQYKKSLGDIDTQLDKESAKALKSVLKSFEGMKFNGFTYVGTKYGADFNNLFIQPKKYNKVANCIQIDFEFVKLDNDGNVSTFDRFNKNSSYTDLKAGIKGKFKVEFISAMFDSKFKCPGVVFQNKKNELSKAYKKDYVNDWTFGNKGVRQKFSKVLDNNGEQLMHNGIPAFRINDVIEDENITDLSKIFNLLFDLKPTTKLIEKFDSYLGCLDICNNVWKDKNLRNTLNVTWSKRAAERSMGNEDMYNIVMKAFYNIFTDLTPISYEEAMGSIKESHFKFSDYVNMIME